ncbi:MAG: glycosyltransferase, partial [Candidatus Hinthialibacter sp.]
MCILYHAGAHPRQGAIYDDLVRGLAARAGVERLMLVSVIIPALNEAENIRACIAAVRRDYAPDEVEIVVADGGSTDGTLDMIPAGVAHIPTERGRAVQMNRGAAAAHGDILLFCHADSLLPAGWRAAVIDALGDPGVSGGVFRTQILPETTWLLWLRN